MSRYSPVKITFEELKLQKQQKDTLLQLSSELKVIKKTIPNLKDIIVRGGFLLDTVLGIEPHDIDLFYSLKKWDTKNWQGCKCHFLKEEIKKQNAPLINSRKTDLGHILKGEIYQDPIDKVIGIFSHHDINSRFCLDTDGNLWSCKETLDGVRNRIHEWDYDAHLQFAYFPYQGNDTYTTFFTRNIIRGLRMIHTKKYIGVGPIFRSFVEKSPYLFDEILKDKKQTSDLKRYIVTKTDGMSIGDFQLALEKTKVKNIIDIMKRVNTITQQ